MKPRDKQQVKSVKELLEKKKAILTEDCGGGKTFEALYAGKKTGLPVYIVCPANVKAHWQETADKLKMEVEISSYNKIWATYKTWKKKGVLICDECHKGIGQKEFWKSNTIRAIFYLSRRCSYIFLLSATPSQHRPMDFYWLLKLTDAWEYDRDFFRHRYMSAYYNKNIRVRGRPILLDGAVSNVKELVKIFDKVRIQNFKRKLKFKIKTIKAPDTGYEEPQFQDVALWRSLVGKIKLKWFKHYLKSRGLMKKRAIYFTHHREITIELAGFLGCDYIIGGQRATVRQKIFDNLDKHKKVVVSLKAGGEGINELDGFDTCFFVECNYSPLQDRQAVLRMARDKKTKVLYVNYFITKDEHTYAVNKRKHLYLSEVI